MALQAEDQKAIGGRGMTGSRSWSSANRRESRTVFDSVVLAKVSALRRPRRSQPPNVVDFSQIGYANWQKYETRTDCKDVNRVAEMAVNLLNKQDKAGTVHPLEALNGARALTWSDLHERGQPDFDCRRF